MTEEIELTNQEKIRTLREKEIYKILTNIWGYWKRTPSNKCR